MTERLIQRQISRLFGNYDYPLCNTFIFAWESDFFCVSKSGYTVEVEVKITKSDFKKDFVKLDKHNLLTNHKAQAILRSKREFEPWLRPGQTEYVYRAGDSSHVSFCCPADHIPNKFYYACPEGLIALNDVPAYAGLIYVSESKTYEVKKAPFLHKNVVDHKPSLLQKYYWKCINDRRELLIMLGAFRRGDLTDHQKEVIEKLKDRFF